MFEVENTNLFTETKSVELFSEGLRLECGVSLDSVTVAYETYGSLNADRTNAVLICHALTASAHAAGVSRGSKEPGWWSGLIGPGKAIDTGKYFVVCPNVLGSCYGSTGPTSTNPKTGRRYAAGFPQITIRDIVRVQKALLDWLRVERLVCVTGSSFGGMQVLEWGIMYPEFCEALIPISTAASQTAWCLALNAIARAAIVNDPEWQNGEYVRQPANGLALARMVGMTSYRSPEEFNLRFGGERQNSGADMFDQKNLFQVESYLRHQGEKLVRRFDANTYLTLSRALDLHDVGYGRGGVTDALRSIKARTLCIGVSSDQRYPTSDQKKLVGLIAGAEYAEIDSIHGHDAFLIEYAQLNAIVAGVLETQVKTAASAGSTFHRILYERLS